MSIEEIIGAVRKYFNIMPDMEDRAEIVSQISQGVSFKGANLWVLIFAIFIASLGLDVNSTAVIIGAMLISPLMGPIIGMGLAIGINDIDLLRRSYRNFGVATLISVLTATVYFLITPLGEAQSELLARTSPTIYDVLIATFGGAAGITALCTKGKGNVIPGVAIATALMPPLCTAGFGLASGNILYFLGAFYLFFINTVFITISTYVGVRLMHFPKKQFLKGENEKRARRVVWGLVVVTMIPAAIMTFGIVRRGISDSNVRNFLKNELTQSGTQIISGEILEDSLWLNVVAVGKEISESKITEAEKRLASYGLKDYRLHLIQGTRSDSLLQLSHQLTQAASSRENREKQVLELNARVSELTSQLADYTRLERLSSEIRGELAAVFPQVRTVALSKAVQAQRDTTATTSFVSAMVGLSKGKRLSSEERLKLKEWLRARCKADSLVLCVME